MKRLVCLLLALCLLTACGTPGAGSSDIAAEPDCTEEELFLQNAYWYLQSDEKEIFSWENGVLEDYCTEESRKIISPEGETEIQGMDLRRVQYVVWQLEGTLADTINLYFQKDGAFVGTDGSRYWEGQEKPRNVRYWDGDVSMWLFPAGPEMDMDGTWEFSSVLRKNSEGTSIYMAFAGSYTELEFFRDGMCVASGIDASAQELEMEQGTVVVEKLRRTKDYLNPDEAEPGAYTVRAIVWLEDVTDGDRTGTQWTLTKFCDFALK